MILTTITLSKSELKQAHQTIQELKAQHLQELADLEEDLAAQRETIDEHLSTLEEIEGYVDKLEARLVVLSNAREKSRTDDRAEQQLQEMQAKLEALELDLELAVQNRTLLEDLNKAIKEEHDRLQQERDGFFMQMENLENQLNAALEHQAQSIGVAESLNNKAELDEHPQLAQMDEPCKSVEDFPKSSLEAQSTDLAANPQATEEIDNLEEKLQTLDNVELGSQNESGLEEELLLEQDEEDEEDEEMSETSESEDENEEEDGEESNAESEAPEPFRSGVPNGGGIYTSVSDKRTPLTPRFNITPIKNRRHPLRFIRKSFARITGMHRFFSKRRPKS